MRNFFNRTALMLAGIFVLLFGFACDSSDVNSGENNNQQHNVTAGSDGEPSTYPYVAEEMQDNSFIYSETEAQMYFSRTGYRCPEGYLLIKINDANFANINNQNPYFLVDGTMREFNIAGEKVCMRVENAPDKDGLLPQCPVNENESTNYRAINPKTDDYITTSAARPTDAWPLVECRKRTCSEKQAWTHWTEDPTSLEPVEKEGCRDMVYNTGPPIELVPEGKYFCDNVTREILNPFTNEVEPQVREFSFALIYTCDYAANICKAEFRDISENDDWTGYAAYFDYDSSFDAFVFANHLYEGFGCEMYDGFAPHEPPPNQIDEDRY